MKTPETSKEPILLDAAVAGPLFMLSAALLFTVLNILIKLLGPQYSVWHIGFFRFFGGAVIIQLLFGHNRNPWRGNNIPLLIIRGLTGTVAFIAMITALRLLPISTTLVLFYSFPAFSAVFSFWFYGERIGIPGILCILVVMGGIGVLLDFRMEGALIGQVMAVIGGLFAGVTVTFIRALRENNGPVVIYLYLCLTGALVTLPDFLLHPVVPATPMEWVMILGIVLASLAAQLLMNQGFFYCRGWEGGVLMSSEVIFTAIAGIVFLEEAATLRFWIGGGLIFGSVVTLNRMGSPSSRPQEKKSRTGK
ncbi:MAG: DMT family transporter [Thermodesulfobacteriota bacterium]